MPNKKKGASVKVAPWYVRLVNPCITFCQNWGFIILAVGLVLLVLLRG